MASDMNLSLGAAIQWVEVAVQMWWSLIRRRKFRDITLDLRFDGAVWLADDLSSAGSCADGQRFKTVQLQDGMSIRLGQEGSPVIGIGFAGQAAQQKVENEKSVDPNASLGPALSANRVVETSGTVPVGDTALRLELDDTVRTFPTGQTALLGRDASCDLRTDNKLVSGTHCQFSHDGQNWWVEDLGSTRGTFIDGKKVVRSKVEGTLFVMLGGDDAGVPLRVVTAGEHIKPKDRRPLLVASAALLLVVVAGAAAALFWPTLWPDGDGSPNSDDEVAAAKAATVLIFSENALGSGAFISDELVLTNRHVAEDGEMLLAVSDVEDAPVAFRYRAEQVASHPYLDVALVRVIETISFEGEDVIVMEPQAPPGILSFGDSKVLRSGQGINALGFPAATTLIGESGGELVLPAVTVSEGEIVTFQQWPGCDNSDAEDLLIPGGFSSCAPEGALGRGNMVSSDLSGSGGSGGPVIADGRIVAVRYAASNALTDDDTISTGGTAVSIPVEFFPRLDH